MLNNVVSQTQHQSLKPFKKDNKADEQIQQLSERFDALSTDIVTEQITVDNITVNSKITSQAAEIDNVATKLVSTDNLEASSASLGAVRIENAEVDAITTPSLTANKIDVDDLTIAGNLQLNTVQSSSATATTGHFDTLTFGGATTENVSITDNDISVGDTVIQSNKITTAEIDAPLVETESVNSHVVSADTKIETPLINTTLLNADKVDVNEAAINSIITKTLENSELIKHTGKLNLDPEQLSVYDWYAVDVKLGNFTVYLRSTYRTINDEEQTFHVTIIGTKQSAIICYDETDIGQILDFSFDTVTGNLRIRFHGTNYLYYGISTLDEEPLPLEIVYNAEEYEFFHEPKRMRGYVFQSYNDNSVEFYFGGEVFVHSLSAEFQEFEEQMTKKLYVEKTILLPLEYNQDESIHTWNPGLEGDYITNRINEFGHQVVTWEHPVNNTEYPTALQPEGTGNHLITENTLVNYNGTNETTNPVTGLTDTNYSITELGDNTTVHGNLKVNGNTKTQHIYDGEALTAEDLALLPDNSLYVDDTDNTLYRKSTVEGNVRLDRLATLKDGNWVDKNNFPLIYDEVTDSLKPSSSLELSELDIAGDLRVGGDAYITGTLHYTQEELIDSTADFITLRANNSASLAAGEYSGVAINNYDGEHSAAIATDRTGTIRIGTGAGTSTTYADIYYVADDNKWYSDEALTTEVFPQGNLSAWESLEKLEDSIHYVNAVFKVFDFSDLEPIATRDEEALMADKALTRWDADNTKLKTIALPVKDEQTLQARVTGTTTTVYTDGVNFYEEDTDATVEPSGTAGTPSAVGNFVLYNSVWYTNDTSDWFIVDDFIDNTNWTVESDTSVTDVLETLTPVTISSVVYSETTDISYTWIDKAPSSLVFDTVTDFNTYKLTHTVPQGTQVFIRTETQNVFGDDK